jgi:hypothetical protein
MSTLRNIIGNVANHAPWLDALTKTMAAIYNHKEPPSIEATIYGVDNRAYRPVMQAVRRRSYDNALVSAHISLHEKINIPIRRAPAP